MEKSIKSLLRQACSALLRPIASMLLKAGMTWKEFSDLSKTVFVSVASEEFGIKGRPTNVSRTSILTGISRKEVRRQRDLIEADVPMIPEKTTDATRLLSVWFQDELYCDADGTPKPLPRSGPAPSFETLFETYGGDTPEQTLIKELKSVGSVEETSDGRFVAKRRYHMPVQTDIGHIQVFCSNLNDHATTLCVNLYGAESDKRLEGHAVNLMIDPDALVEFHELADQSGQRFLEEIDAWLTEHSIDEDKTGKNPIRLGVGVYAIEEESTKGIA